MNDYQKQLLLRGSMQLCNVYFIIVTLTNSKTRVTTQTLGREFGSKTWISVLKAGTSLEGSLPVLNLPINTFNLLTAHYFLVVSTTRARYQIDQLC